ncbi:hypothetical protein [Niastella sp. OAS944]|uniref:hypothetical protein n=1 Tax=Niastella sp. OAS944 TaxID=2664089 RepID=UPI003499ADA1|nr:hypothetical protein [Chitinophagaceae bacterium OAS944]
MLKNIIRLSLFASFISCKSGEAKQKPVGKDIFAMADSMDAADSAMPAGSVKADEYYANADGNNEDPNFPNYPLASFGDDSTLKNYPATILTTGQFHEDEVSREDAGRNWYGIFQNKDGYYIDTTHITTKRVEDPVAEDEAGKPTGWEVKTTNTDTSLLLFAGVNGIKKHQIKPVSLSKNIVWPGESVTYTNNGITYTLYATGNKRKERPNDEYYIVTSYRLFIKATINGSEHTQLLVSCRSFDDVMVEVLFTGDIDGDNIPDLIINTSHHYNVEAPALYLSKPAGSNEVLKLMGWHVSVGC